MSGNEKTAPIVPSAVLLRFEFEGVASSSLNLYPG